MSFTNKGSRLHLVAQKKEVMCKGIMRYRLRKGSRTVQTGFRTMCPNQWCEKFLYSRGKYPYRTNQARW